MLQALHAGLVLTPGPSMQGRTAKAVPCSYGHDSAQGNKCAALTASLSWYSCFLAHAIRREWSGHLYTLPLLRGQGGEKAPGSEGWLSQHAKNASDNCLALCSWPLHPCN